MASPPRLPSLFDRAAEVRIITCTITATSPLTVTIGVTSGIRGVPMKGVTYTTGAALALISEVGQPIIIQREP